MVYQFSALSDGQAISFNPSADVLNFDQSAIAAADIRVTVAGSNVQVSHLSSGKDVALLNVNQFQLATSNVTFADGSRLLFGDNSTALNDDAANSLTGTAGRDLLAGFGAIDTLSGGLGNDTYIVGTGDVLSDSGGIDTVETGVNWTLATGFENLTMTGTAALSMNGNHGNNFIIGNSANNFFNPRGGDDTILGGAGNDKITLGGGGALNYGAEVIDGGSGFDTVNFEGFGRSAITVDLAAGTLSGGGDAGSGSASLASIEGFIADGFDDRLSGSAAAESLSGLGGNDTLSGLGGNDTLAGGLGSDTFVFAAAPASGNVDQVTDFVSATDKLSFDNSVFTAVGGAGDFVAGDARFAVGPGFTSGRDPSDRIVYDTTFRNLYYDANGSDAGGSQLIATLPSTPTLAATDITVTGEAAPPPPPPGPIQGTAGDDSLTGTEGDDSIDGLGGDDTIDGRGGDDTLDGGDGWDTLNGGAGVDLVRGGSGNDTIDGLGGNDTIDGGAGVDMLSFQSAGSAVVVDMRTGTANGGSAAGSGNDVFFGIEQITGTAFNDHMTSQDGVQDHIRSGDLYGAQGDDTLIGGAGDDLLSGDGAMHFAREGVGNGNDEMRGGGGDDAFSINFRLAGGTYGNDTIDGGDGTDVIVMNEMAPMSALFINLATGVMSGGGANGAGSATLVSVEDVFFSHGNTNDVIIGNGGANRLTGSDGYDTIRGGGGDDDIGMTAVSHTAELPAHAELFGEDGNDVVSRGSMLTEHGQGSVLISGGTGNDTVSGGPQFSADRFLFAEAPGSANADLVRRFEAGSGFDKIELDTTAHANLGATGNFAPNDARFASGAGFTSGQDATDRVIYNTTTGQLFYDADGSGTGTGPLLIATLDRTPGWPELTATDIVVVGESQPNPNQGTAGNDSLIGTAGDDLLQGLAGNDTLNGLAGNDTLDAGTGGDRLIGGTGNDIYIVDGPGDTVIENAGEGTDMVRSSATRTLDANVENLTLTGTAAINGTGNSLNNVITGNSANNVLNGGTAADTLIGGAGNDTYIVDGPGDTVIENSGGGTDTVQSSASRTLEANVNNLTLTGSAAINGTGNELTNGITGNSAANLLAGGEGNDTLRGLGGNDALSGGVGNDRLEGRSGNDSLTGGSGVDHFVFRDSPTTGGVDRITDFVRGTDELLFENAVFSGLGSSGALASGDGRFRSGSSITTGQDSTDRLIYNTSTDSLYYDADGSGSGGSQLIATFAGDPALTATDFTVI